MSRCFRVSIILFLVMGVANCAYSQSSSGQLTGHVTDPGGLAVVGAKVQAVNVETGVVSPTETNAAGLYNIPNLPVGSYRVVIEKDGFERVVKTAIDLHVADVLALNFSLQLGSVSQSVTVSGEAPMVNTTSGALGGLIDEHGISDLPLNGRNYTDLTLLQPGVTKFQNMNAIDGQSGTWFSSNGAPLRSNAFYLDGAPLVNFFGATASSASGDTLGVDGIKEYRIITNNFSAEYGMAMGSQMIIASKGGSNKLHGSIFEFFRNSQLDARNYYDYGYLLPGGKRLPEFQRNDFGGSLGGPIIKDKTFIFGVYEELRQRLGVSAITQTIPAAARINVAPVVVPLLGLFPLPNIPGTSNYTYPAEAPTDEEYGQVRVDHTISTSDSFFGRYTITQEDGTLPRSTPDFYAAQTSRSQFATLSESHTFSPSFLSTFRMSFSRTHISTDPEGISGPNISFVPGKVVGALTVSGFSAIGSDATTPGHGFQNIWTWSDDLFYTRGKHSLKFGTLINRYEQFVYSAGQSTGAISFANLANFLAATPVSYDAATPGSNQSKTFNYTTLGFYIQDDWRPLRNLTLNLGLRYEFNTTILEKHNQAGYFVPETLATDTGPVIGPIITNDSLRNFSPRLGFAWDVFGNGKTSVRGGYSILYDIANLGGPFLIMAQANPPFASQTTVNAPPTFAIPFVLPAADLGKSIRTMDHNWQQAYIHSYDLSVDRQLPFDMLLSVAYAGSRGHHLVANEDQNYTTPQIVNGRYFWTGNEQRLNPLFQQMANNVTNGLSWYNSLQASLIKRLGKGLQFQTSYTWSKMMDNAVGQSGGEYTNVASIYRQYAGDLNLDRGLSTADVPQNLRFNATYHFPGLGSDGGLSKLTNGWWTSGILTLESGQPFTLALGSNRSRSKTAGNGGGADRPDLVFGRNNSNITHGTTKGCAGVAAGQQLGTPTLYYDPCAFAIPAIGFEGTSGRSILLGPGIVNFDWSIVKDTRLKFLGEGGNMEFRAESFNLFNRANFGMPSRTVYAAVANVEPVAANAGTITSTVTPSRQIQLALKFMF